jgi:hypothetical protein
MDPIQIHNIADLEELFPKNEDGNYDVNADEGETYSLAGADLAGANLSRAILERINLSRAILEGVNLTRAILEGANLSDANLTNADLINAYLINANFTGADLTGANLTGAVITINTVKTMLKSETTLVGVIGIDLTEQTLSFAIMSNTLNPLSPNEYDKLKYKLLSKKDADEKPRIKGGFKKRRHKSSKRRHKSSKRRRKSSKRRHRTFRK